MWLEFKISGLVGSSKFSSHILSVELVSKTFNSLLENIRIGSMEKGGTDKFCQDTVLTHQHQNTAILQNGFQIITTPIKCVLAGHQNGFP